MNPKLKKRKREPVVSHASKTDMHVNYQVVHDHIAEAQPSRFDTPVAHQSARFISTTRMVQVANMTTWNNTRLTSLIEHMPDMIKIVIDKALAPKLMTNRRICFTSMGCGKENAAALPPRLLPEVYLSRVFKTGES
ncbi:hypothetical protein HAX54_046209 [Datura stramonium]|uniref:Uncharacterized protein n=1 Tax=Datura stramonium TaxID=4076 RepID=A0ABS8SRU6_DATST|nr:hypothetical protein [Datura stramonium]